MIDITLIDTFSKLSDLKRQIYNDFIIITVCWTFSIFFTKEIVKHQYSPNIVEIRELVVVKLNVALVLIVLLVLVLII